MIFSGFGVAKHSLRTLIISLIIFISLGCTKRESYQQNLKEVNIPIAGNTYQTSPESSEKVSADGITDWENKESTFSTFLKRESSKSVEVLMRAKVNSGNSVISTQVGDQARDITLSNTEYSVVPIGEFNVPSKSYFQIALNGKEKSGNSFANITDLILKVPRQDSLTYIEHNGNNQFYWGRRGPSVHLKYVLPEQNDIEWFYNEIQVPEGEDPVGSYFMANGFAQGYFGIQVNSESERRVLFSVWSPYETDNPEDIPESERIQLLAKGEDVEAGKFGEEGSGGQSYLVYPWESGEKYKFLNRVKPDGNGNTIYTAYFYSQELGEWKLIAQFLRPKTDTWMTGVYSFLENFSPSNGYKSRKAFYKNQWVLDTEGNWHSVSEARFTGDAIANSGFRDDFTAGTNGNRFYLRNGGFNSGSVPLETPLKRSVDLESPDIPFEDLPNGS